MKLTRRVAITSATVLIASVTAIGAASAAPAHHGGGDHRHTVPASVSTAHIPAGKASDHDKKHEDKHDGRRDGHRDQGQGRDYAKTVKMPAGTPHVNGKKAADLDRSGQNAHAKTIRVPAGTPHVDGKKA
ncbi:hypothetical protein ACN20G_32705 (plasmid) [Streptomyces sp. BI20]|uniref:hypothetical protein n=1 Tax=Streptomyces sp. BI20 TaxID=3403460 RepID=UPI003C75BF20